MSDKLVPVRRVTTAVDTYSQKLLEYLGHLGLPNEAVLAQVTERSRVIGNLPEVVTLLSNSARQSAMYLSKFIAACGAGLFDAALNFLWNETVVCLRGRVARFDLSYFYDSVITDSTKRKAYRTTDDLVKLDDWELIRGCRETGLISDIGFRHLDYIRDMRNWASAAHPNQNELTGLQLVTWLETCIREVLAKEPSGHVLEARRLLRSLRTQRLTLTDAPPIIADINKITPPVAESLLRSLFGMFTDPGLDANVRANIRLIAKASWDKVHDETRHQIGLQHATFAANAEIERKQLAEDFLRTVGGNSYLATDQLSLELSEKLDNLWSAHLGWDNWRNEVPHARSLAAAVPSTGRIPKTVSAKYVRVVMMCRIGNGRGSSWGAEDYYNQMIVAFQDDQIAQFVALAADLEFASRLQFPDCSRTYASIAATLKTKTSSPNLTAALSLIERTPHQEMPQLRASKKFKGLLGAILP